MCLNMKTKPLIIIGIVVLIAGLSAVVLFDGGTFSENNVVIKSDAEILDEINLQAAIHKSDYNEEKFREQAALMEEKIRQIAFDSLGMNITVVSVDLTDPETGIGSNNFPFKDSSEIEIPSDKEPFPICNIPQKIPIHLKKFLDDPMFAMFSEKYFQYDAELIIMDERPGESLVHYGITATSDDGMYEASTFFHASTCTDEMQEDFPKLLCRNIAQNEIEQSFNQDDITSSLQLEEFCIIPLDPWRNSINEYGKKIQEKRLEQFEMIVEPDNHEEFRKMLDEHERLDSLRYITSLIVNDSLESEITQNKIREYNEKFGSLPDELLELIEQRK